MRGDLVFKVNEIFKSIQGESLMQGFPCVFIRLHGCNLNCSYCDTKLGNSDFVFMTSNKIFNEVEKLNCKFVCITGGEPLIQKGALEDLLKLLVKNKYTISIETNGTIVIPRYWSSILFNNRIDFVFDIKTPVSGYPVKDNFEIFRQNMWAVSENTEFKFIISSEEDMEYSVLAMEKIKSFYEEFWEGYAFPHFSFSPICHRISKGYFKLAKYIADYLVENNIEGRLQLQLHKLIGVC